MTVLVSNFKTKPSSYIMTAENYEEVLKGKYPAKAHAKKVAEWIVAKGGDKTGTIYLEAQKSRLLEVGLTRRKRHNAGVVVDAAG